MSTISAGSRARFRLRFAIVTALFCFGNTIPAAAADCGGTPAVTTDKSDYGPQETVTISGSAFDCGDVLSVLVTAPDGTTLSGDGLGSAGPDAVITDGSGAFTLAYRLSGILPGGDTYEGQLGAYRVSVLNASGTVLASTYFSDAQGYFSCALTTSGGVKCWGYNEYGSLGNGTFTHSNTPVDVTGLTSGVAQVSVGYLHACALMTSGGVKCWGLNISGELGTGAFSSSFPYGSPTPQNVTGLTSGVAQIRAGPHGTCAVTTGGGARCWGYNEYGQLGNGTFANSATPVDVTGLASGVAQVSFGYVHACALTTSGGVKCWGFNGVGGLGDGTFTNSATPVDVSGLASGVAQVSSGFYHTCALTTSGGAKCWGANFSGGLGNGTFTNSATTVDVSGLTIGVAQVSSGFTHTCALTTSGSAKCWGDNIYGQLGNGTYANSATPVNVSGLSSGVAALWDAVGVVDSDSTSPTASPTQSPAANGAGWSKTDVTVTWNWTDDAGGSGIDNANCTTTGASSAEGNPISLSATCKDLAGNTGNASYDVKVDKTKPTIGAAASTSANPAGWYNSNVTVQFTCIDSGGSGIAPAGGCPADETLSDEGAAVVSTIVTAVDTAGNESNASNVVTVKIDKTKPTLSPSVSPNPVLLNGTATATSGAADPLSGLASQSCDAVVTNSVGAKSVNCTAADNAGNSNSASGTYQVNYVWTGFFQPVDNLPTLNSVKAGSAVPVKFGLGGNQGLGIFAAGYPLSRVIACDSGAALDDIEQTVTAGGSSLSYDPVSGQYHYVWKTDKAWASTCRQLVVKLADGTEHLANFRLK